MKTWGPRGQPLSVSSPKVLGTSEKPTPSISTWKLVPLPFSHSRDPSDIGSPFHSDSLGKPTLPPPQLSLRPSGARTGEGRTRIPWSHCLCPHLSAFAQLSPLLFIYSLSKHSLSIHSVCQAQESQRETNKKPCVLDNQRSECSGKTQ